MTRRADLIRAEMRDLKHERAQAPSVSRGYYDTRIRALEVRLQQTEQRHDRRVNAWVLAVVAVCFIALAVQVWRNAA